MRSPYFLLLGLLLVAPGRAADHDVAGLALGTDSTTLHGAVGREGPVGIAPGQLAADSRPDSVRFEAVDVFVDSGEKPLAAYQFELKATSGDVLLAGLEGGEHPAFKSAPYYDPTALLQNKIIVASFSTAGELPHGRTRVARLMVQVTGPAEPAYDARLSVAGSIDGKPVAAAQISTAIGHPDSAVPLTPETSRPSPTSNTSEGVVR